MMNEIPQEVIVVEGRDDSQRLIQTYGPQIKTIETNGSALSRQTLQQIVRAAETSGIIVFTDPDYQGERIRRLIQEAVPEARHAYLSQDQARAQRPGCSLGIEHAQAADIRSALAKVMTPQLANDLDRIPMSELMRLKLVGHSQARRNRQRVAQHFNLGHLNGKQLQKRLAQYNIQLSELERFMKEATDDQATTNC